MGSISGAESASRGMYGNVEGILAVPKGGQGVLNRGALKLVRDFMPYGQPTTETDAREQASFIDYPVLQGAAELDLTLEEHGEYIVHNNAAFHPETD